MQKWVQTIYHGLKMYRGLDFYPSKSWINLSRITLLTKIWTNYISCEHACVYELCKSNNVWLENNGIILLLEISIAIMAQWKLLLENPYIR